MKELCAGLLITLLILHGAPALAAWQVDGNEVTREYTTGGPVHAVPDAGGGLIFAWYAQSTQTSPQQIRAQRIGSDGSRLWGASGVTVLNITPIYSLDFYIGVAADGSGGVFIAWADARSDATGKHQIYVQHLDANGNPLWVVNGAQATFSNTGKSYPAVVSTGDGGAIVSYRTAAAEYAQVLDATGAPSLPADGVQLAQLAMSSVGNSMAVTDGQSGAIIIWYSFVGTSYKTIAQRVSKNGVLLWGTNGVTMFDASRNCFLSDMVADESGGVYVVAAVDFGSLAPFIQHLLPSGSPAWPSTGVELAPGHYFGGAASVAVCSSGGVWAGWVNDYYRIGIQRVNALGALELPINGEVTTSGRVDAVRMAPATDGKVVIAAHGSSGDDYKAILVHELSQAGEAQWSMPFLSTTRTGSLDCEGVLWTTDGAHSVYWEEDAGNAITGGVNVVKCQRVEEDGSWAKPLPVVQQVSDIPNDEGGFVRLKVLASPYDDVSTTSFFPVTGYNIWRRVFPGAASAFETVGSIGDLDQARKPGTRFSSSGALTDGLPEGEWESLGFHAANQSDNYNVVAATLRDSFAGSPYSETYVVVAHSTSPFCYFVSGEASGSSVDNLPPALPGNFQASTTGAGATLTWSANQERDLAGYRVYADTDPNFSPGPSNLIAVSTSTTFVDQSWAPGIVRYYKLSATDRHGNVSEYAAARAPGPVAVLLKSFNAVVRAGSITISWEMYTTPAGASFKITRSTIRGAEVELDNAGLSSQLMSYRYQDTSVQGGQQYRYRVAIVEEGTSAQLFETSAISVPARVTELSQNSPNPFNPSTSIRFALSSSQNVSLVVYDVSGSQIAVLVAGFQSAGEHLVEWKGLDASGHTVASGLYFYELRTSESVLRKKMTLVK